MNPENYSIPSWHSLLGQTTKQPLSNSEPQKSWKYKQLRGLRPDPDPIKKISVCYLQFLKNTKYVRIVLNHF